MIPNGKIEVVIEQSDIDKSREYTHNEDCLIGTALKRVKIRNACVLADFIEINTYGRLKFYKPATSNDRISADALCKHPAWASTGREPRRGVDEYKPELVGKKFTFVETSSPWGF